VLFVTWDGPEQTYLESLFLPIFAAVPRTEWHVLQFRWGTLVQRELARTASEQLGIPYRSISVFRRPQPLATALMIAIGAQRLVQEVRRRSIDVVMPRSIIPAAIALAARRVGLEARIVYDADGLVADERVDFAGWSATGVQYRIWRDVEAQILRAADSVITRTAASKEVLVARAGAGMDPDRIVVIPNGVDDRRFSPGDARTRREARVRGGVPDGVPWLVYAGSVGPQYHIPAILRCFAAALRREPAARLAVLTGQPAQVEPILVASGLPRDRIFLDRVPPTEVPAWLRAADLGFALREPSFSQRGVSPIKVGEYLLSGLPLVAIRGVGDLDQQLRDDVALLLDDAGDASVTAVADWLFNRVLPNRETLRMVCRQRGVDVFSLEACAQRYRTALDLVTGEIV
jgi:glycosyltransferase involved in cell wall biosynthesis